MAQKPKMAPGRLETVREFINTLDRDDDSDAIGSVEGLTAWLLDRDLLAPDEDVDEQDVAHAIEVRESLRSMALANNDAALVDDRVRRGIAEAAARAGLVIDVQPDATARLKARAAGADGALGRLLAVVYTAMADGTWSRLKACRNDSCQWAFYDHSKNRSAHWCSMSGCGNQVKARTYRARHKEDGRLSAT